MHLDYWRNTKMDKEKEGVEDVLSYALDAIYANEDIFKSGDVIVISVFRDNEVYTDLGMFIGDHEND